MDIKTIQQRLTNNFNSIRENRDTKEHPIFAIEHKLEKDDLNRFFNFLFENCNQKNMDEFWLLWVIFATERGYNFNGKDYWGNFENEIKRYRINGDISLLNNTIKSKIRKYFEKFQDEFNGSVKKIKSKDLPSNKSIIYFPILHSIIPLNNQQKFFEQISRFANNKIHDLEDVIEFLNREKDESHNISFLYSTLLSDNELLRIILQAFFDRSFQDGSVISSVTLERIKNDLKNRKFKKIDETLSKLKIKSNTYSHRTTGNYTLSFIKSPSVNFELHKNDEIYIPKIRIDNFTKESIKLYDSQHNQSLFNKIDIFDLVFPFNDLEKQIKFDKFKISRVLSIINWPNNFNDIIRLKKDDEEYTAISEQLFLFEPTHSFDQVLFEITDSPIYKDKKNLSIDTNKEYLFLTKKKIVDESNLFVKVNISIDSIYGYKISVPENINEEIKSNFEKVGLEMNFNTEIYSIGLCSLNQTSEEGGDFHFFEDEEPLFLLKNNFSISQYTVEHIESSDAPLIVDNPENNLLLSFKNLTYGQNIIRIQSKLVWGESENEEREDNFVIYLKDRENTQFKSLEYLNFKLHPDKEIIQYDDLLDNIVKIYTNDFVEELQIVLQCKDENTNSKDEFAKSIKKSDKNSFDLILNNADKNKILNSNLIELTVYAKDNKELGFFRKKLRRPQRGAYWTFKDNTLKLINEEYDPSQINFNYYDVKNPGESKSIVFEDEEMKLRDQVHIDLSKYSQGVIHVDFGNEFSMYFRLFVKKQGNVVTIENLSNSLYPTITHNETKDFSSLLKLYKIWCQNRSSIDESFTIFNSGSILDLQEKYCENILSNMTKIILTNSKVAYQFIKWLSLEKKIIEKINTGTGSKPEHRYSFLLNFKFENGQFLGQLTHYIPNLLKVYFKRINERFHNYKSIDFEKIFDDFFSISYETLRTIYRDIKIEKLLARKVFAFFSDLRFKNTNIRKECDFFNNNFLNEIFEIELTTDVYRCFLIGTRYLTFILACNDYKD